MVHVKGIEPLKKTLWESLVTPVPTCILVAGRWFERPQDKVY